LNSQNVYILEKEHFIPEIRNSYLWVTYHI
jgi:hypothetical protein